MVDVQKTIDTTYSAVRPYMPGLVQRLLVTYGVPIALTMLMAIFGGRLLVAITRDVGTANMTALLLNIVILMVAWRFLERRTQATGLFVQYTRYSRQRRDLQKAETITSDDLEALHTLASDFITSAQGAGLRPAKRETARE